MTAHNIIFRHYRTIALATAIFAAALLTSIPQARAVEDGATITPMGITDFESGYLPPTTPVGLFGLRVAYYGANKLKDSHGNTSPNGLDLDVMTIGLAYIHMTNWHLWGARYGFGTVVPFVDMNGTLSVSTPAGSLKLSSNNFALGDVQFQPVMLGWNFGRHGAANIGLQIQAPTGRYRTHETFNNGVNHWTITPYAAGTWLLGHGYELSSLIQLSYNTENPDTDYTSGMEYYQEYGVGKHFGPFVAGAAGYFYQQISNDHGPNLISGNRARVFAVGPALMFNKPHLPMVSLHAYKEFAAKNRAQGYNIAVRIGMSF